MTQADSILNTGSATLPLYPETSSQFSSPRVPFSPVPPYMSPTLGRAGPLEPQEVDGQGLTEEEYKRRLTARAVASTQEGPVELSAMHFSAPDPDAEMQNPLLKPNHTKVAERTSRLRSTHGVGDLRGIASRSPSRSPAMSDDIG